VQAEDAAPAARRTAVEDDRVEMRTGALRDHPFRDDRLRRAAKRCAEGGEAVITSSTPQRIPLLARRSDG